MSVTAHDIKKIAQLARLAIAEEEIPHYTQELSSILQLVAQMAQVDTSHCEPMSHPVASNQRLRPDGVTETNQRELLQSIAPSTAAGLYLVPQVIE